MACTKLLLCNDHPPIRAAVTYIAKQLNKDIRLDEAVPCRIFPTWLCEV